MIRNFSCELTPLVGSSISSSCGRRASATAMSISLRVPSGSSLTMLVERSASPKSSSSASISSRSGCSRSGRNGFHARSRAAAASSRLSMTHCSWNSCGDWNARAMPIRVIVRGASAVMSRPRNWTLPAVGVR